MNSAAFIKILGQNSAQGAVLVLMVLAVQWFFRRQLTPRWRCALWFPLVIRLMVPVSTPSPLSIFNLVPVRARSRADAAVVAPAAQAFARKKADATPRGSTGAPEETLQSIPESSRSPDVIFSAPPHSPAIDEPARRLDLSWPEAGLGLWLAGIATLLIHLALTLCRLARRFADAVPVADPSVLSLLEDCRRRMGVTAGLQIVESGAVDSPTLHGVLRARLVLPKQFVTRFSSEELRFVFLHELAHIKRRDLPLNWLIYFLQVAHWFNPLVWLGFASWRADRELACDALALEAAGEGQNKPYGEAILRLLEAVTHRVTAPGMVGILEDPRQLRSRIRMIADFKRTPRWSALGLGLLSVIAIACLTDARSQPTNPPAAVSGPLRAVPPSPNPTPVGPTASAGAGVTPVAQPTATAAVQSGSPSDPGPLMLRLPIQENATLGPDGSNESFRSTMGLRTIDGLPFQIGGLISFRAERAINGRTALSGIRIGRRFDELHLIHFTKWGADLNDTPVARIRLKYVDGSNFDFPIVYGVHIRSYFRVPMEGDERLTDPNSKVIWRSTDASNDSMGYRIFETVLRNPSPERRVASMEVYSAHSLSSYCLIAATTAQSDPHRPITPAAPMGPDNWNLDGNVTVRVLSSTDGAPLADAVLVYSIFGEAQGSAGVVTATDSFGMASIRYPTDRANLLRISTLKEGYSRESMEWKRGEIPKNYEFTLGTGLSIGGVVQDYRGQGTANAALHFNGFLPGAAGDIALETISTRTDSSGRWQISGIPAGLSYFTLEVISNSPKALFVSDTAADHGIKGERVSTAEVFSGSSTLKIPASFPLSGTVVDAKGQPVPKATVRGVSPSEPNDKQRADADRAGRFTLKNLDAGEHSLTVTAPGFAPDFRAVTIGPNNNSLTVVLAPGRNVRGTVRDSAGKTVAGAIVSFDQLLNTGESVPRGRLLDWSTTTGPDGSFFWDSAPRRDFLLNVEKAGYALGVIEIDGSADRQPKIVLLRAIRIHGAVQDADGRPVSRFEIISGFKFREFMPVNWLVSSPHHFNQADGMYSFSPTAPRDPSNSMQVVFKVIANGYAQFESRTFKPDEGDVAYDIRLSRADWISGRIVSADGKPLAHVGVQIAPTMKAGYQTWPISGMSLEHSDFSSDDTGNLRIPSRSGNFVLAAAAPAGFALVSSEDFLKGRQIVLQPWARIEGTILNRDQPVANKTVIFETQAETMRFSPFLAGAVTDGSGRFTFPYVPPGSIVIKFMKMDGGVFRPGPQLVTLDLKPGETKQANISFQGRTVVGQLIRGSGIRADTDLNRAYVTITVEATPPANLDSLAKLQAWNKQLESQRASALLSSVRSDGTFAFETLPLGNYTLSGGLSAKNEGSETWRQVGILDPVHVRVLEGDPNAPVDLGKLTIRAIGESRPN